MFEQNSSSSCWRFIWEQDSGYRHRFCRRSRVLVLTLIFQIKPGAIPFDVIEIIMAVIAAIAAMQVAGGMDYR